eukprot:g9030.t1
MDGPKAKSGHNSDSTTSHTTTFDNDNCANVCRAFGVRSLSELRWSHGCNTRRQLRDVLRQETTDVVEVDVTIGKLLRDGREKAVFDFSFFNCVGARQKQDQEIDLGGRGPGGCSGNNGRGTAGNNLYTTSTTASSANQNLESGGSNFQHQFGIAANEQLILCHFPYTKSDLSLEEFLRVLCDQNDHAKRLQERAAAATAAAGAAEERGHQHVQEDRRDEVNTSKSLGATFFAAEEITDAAPARPSSSCTAPAPSTSATSLSPEVVGEISALCSAKRYLPVLDPARFLQYAAGAGPRAVLSLSWLAGDHAISSKNRQYTDQMIEQMLQLVLFPLIDDGSGLVRSPANAIPHITFAICAQYAAASKKVLDRLLQNIPSASFTLFSGSWSRGISREQYRNLRRMFPPARTFFDVRLQDEKGGKAT